MERDKTDTNGNQNNFFCFIKALVVSQKTNHFSLAYLVEYIKIPIQNLFKEISKVGRMIEGWSYPWN